MIVADIRLYREGLTLILGQVPHLTVVAAAADMQDALTGAHERRPDVALVDMAMPQSLTTIHEIVIKSPTVKVVVLGAPENEEDLISCAEAGIAGYVPRAASLTELEEVLQSVARGELMCSPRVAASLLRHVTTLAASRNSPVPCDSLTVREREIVSLLETGSSNKDIARQLGIEVATVKNHVHNVLEKLRVHRRGQAAARVRQAAHRELDEAGPSFHQRRGDQMT